MTTRLIGWTRGRSLGRRLRTEAGFTLIELLVVILIIGILAAIAVPQFLDQRLKGFDARAKTNVRNTLAEIESCNTRTEDYGDCTTAPGSELAPVEAGTVVTSAGPREFEIVATSQSDNTFTLTRQANGDTDRPCTNTGTVEGGCPPSLTW